MDDYALGYFIGVIIWGLIWGFSAKAVIKNKGYDEDATKYFWLGFFFAFIPLIVAATKPNKSTSQPDNSNVVNDLEKLTKLKEQGAITEQEFNRMKREILESL